MRLVSESKCLIRGLYGLRGIMAIAGYAIKLLLSFVLFLLLFWAHRVARKLSGNCCQIAIQGAHTVFLCHLSRGVVPEGKTSD